VFEYELDEPMALYMAVPFLMSRSMQGMFSGLFFNNPSETFVDVCTSPSGKRETRWVSEAGVLELFVFSGGNALGDVLSAYTTVTGKPYLPPRFAL
jgi:alpha-glucosidase (family GH31 glycosyl hydrolase)